MASVVQTQDAVLSFSIEIKVIVVYTNEMGYEIAFYSEAVQFNLGLNTGHRTRTTGLSQSFVALQMQCALCSVPLIKVKNLPLALKQE